MKPQLSERLVSATKRWRIRQLFWRKAKLLAEFDPHTNCVFSLSYITIGVGVQFAQQLMFTSFHKLRAH